MMILLLVVSVLVSRLEFADRMNMVFVHIPAAWLGMGYYLVLGISSLMYLITRDPVLVIWGKCVTEVGGVFISLTLITGSMWGKMTWGSYWVWDGRLMSVVVLLILYIVSHEMFKKGGKEGSIISFIGLINLPLIKFSVDWWASLHQSSSLKLSSGLFHEVIYYPIVIWLIFMIVISVWWIRLRSKYFKTVALLVRLD